jgi:3-oxoacyl-[acyl-carrier protein] reductase
MTDKPVALVTGGTRGIGLGIATSLASDGYDLALFGRRAEEDVVGAIEGLQDLGADVIYCRGDISELSSHAKLLDEVKERFCRLDLLVNNAGIAPPERKDILEAGEESYDKVMAINLKAPYFLTQAAANWMIEQRDAVPDFRGCIVFVTSVSADTASVARGEYCLSKAGLSMAAQLWAVRLAEFDLPVYEVRPGIIKTDMTAGVTEKYDDLIADGLLLEPRWGQPEDIGMAVAMLARGDLPYATGQVLTLDGGLGTKRL